MAGLVTAGRVYPTCGTVIMRKSGKPDFRCHPRLYLQRREDVDARHKAGHDGGEVMRLPNTGTNGLVRDAATTRSFPRKRESSTVQ
jgi:hypothetical protein